MITMPKPRLLLADDHTLVLEGLCRLLDGEFEVVGAVENGRLLVEAAETLRPDVILLDISMPLLNGIDAARLLQASVPESKLLFVTMHADREYVREAFRAGASGYVLKRSAVSELASALREVLKGNRYITPLIPAEVLVDALDTPQENEGKLTMRQREVLQLVAEGHSAKEIAEVLKISVKTAEFHKAGIMDRLGLRTTAELTRYALAQGMIGSVGVFPS